MNVNLNGKKKLLYIISKNKNKQKKINCNSNWIFSIVGREGILLSVRSQLAITVCVLSNTEVARTADGKREVSSASCHNFDNLRLSSSSLFSFLPEHR